MSDYAFPVALEQVYLKSNVALPSIRAIVRKDLEAPVSIVSDKYQLVPHEYVVKGAEQFVSVFGKPESKFMLSKSGARLVAQYTYNEPRNLKTVQRGDVVGLRVFVENSYNAESAVRVQIGCLVLSCLNGMVVPKSLYSYTYRHVNTQNPIEFPEPSKVLDCYQNQVGTWCTYADYALSDDRLAYEDIVRAAFVRNIICRSAMDRMLGKAGDTYWDLMQAFTWEATHGGDVTPLGRLTRMERSIRFVNEIFKTKTIVVPYEQQEGLQGEVIWNARR